MFRTMYSHTQHPLLISQFTHMHRCMFTPSDEAAHQSHQPHHSDLNQNLIPHPRAQPQDNSQHHEASHAEPMPRGNTPAYLPPHAVCVCVCRTYLINPIYVQINVGFLLLLCFALCFSVFRNYRDTDCVFLCLEVTALCLPSRCGTRLAWKQC